MAELHRLLARQIRKYIPDFKEGAAQYDAFIDAVNQSYEHFENDRALVERAMKLSSDEIWEKNQKLLDDSLRQKLLINSLIQTIHKISPSIKIEEDTDLLRIADVLDIEILKRRQAEGELRIAHDALEKSLHARQSFLLNISHEIRTPLHTVTGMVNLLLQTPTSDTQKEYLKIVNSSAEGLLVIINDLLDMGKIESGKFTLEELNFNLDEVLESLQKSMQIKAREKGIEFVTEKDRRLGNYLIGDPTRLHQIILNLVSNAIKFTVKGRVQLSLQLIHVDDEYEKIQFEVSDTGIGIEEEKLDGIFEQFAQEDGSVARKFGGTGLGLSITRSLVEMMGGEITVKSKKGEGSVFAFTINFRKGDIVNIIETEHIQAEGLRGLRVLVAEDNEINLYLIHSILKNWGIEVHSAASGRECIEILRHDEFDFLFTDLQMPEMDGIEMTRIIRNELGLDIPIVALTANALASEMELCKEAGMNDYVIKPFKLSELYSSMTRNLTHLQIASSPSNLERSRFSLEKLSDLYSGKKDQMFNTLAVFLLQMEKDLERLYATKDCPDRSIVNSIAHRMRPNLELFCMEVLKIELEGLLAAFETQNSAVWGVRILEFIELSQRELNFVRSSVDLTEKVR
jgi:signal transduction histidine kinase/CheY-like chemotaxis protein